jgi:hypothetical protein
MDQNMWIDLGDDVCNLVGLGPFDEMESAVVQPTARRIGINSRDRLHPRFALQLGGNK